jgi:alpha-beta hydrolase superfamily lysophospholipase
MSSPPPSITPYADPAEAPPRADLGEAAARPLELATSGGAPLTAYRWDTLPTPRLQVVLVHGLGEHGRALPYRRLANALVTAGHAVVSYDQPGHGPLAAAARGQARLAQLVDTLLVLLAALRREAARPLVVVGLSMGAVVALLAAGRQPAAQAATVAAALPLGPVAAGRLSLLAARLLGRLVPRWRLGTGIDLTLCADDPQAVQGHRADPLLHDRIALGLAADLLAARRHLRQQVLRPPCPTLVLHGSNDRIAPWDPTADAAMAGAGSRIQRLPDGGHNLLLDRQRGAAVAAILDWLAALEAGGKV